MLWALSVSLYTLPKTLNFKLSIGSYTSLKELPIKGYFSNEVQSYAWKPTRMQIMLDQF